MILIKNLHKTYPGAQPLHVLKGVSLEVKTGEMLAIMGASGSGKSTLLNILGLLDTYDAGSYELDGRRMQGLSEREAAGIRARDIGFIFQSFNLISYKTAVENVALPLFYCKVPYRERTQRAEEYLDKVGLLSWGHHLPSELSGGQQQRVAIARALVSSPKVLLADEPTGALDSKTSENVMTLLTEINQREKQSMIIVTHDAKAAAYCERIVKIEDGLITGEERRLDHRTN